MIDEVRQWVNERYPEADTENDNADVRKQFMRLLDAIAAYSDSVIDRSGHNTIQSFENFITYYYEER